MVGSSESSFIDDGKSSSSSSAVTCSICLDLVADYKERSVATLQCGHQFHLDCIGSAFNIKGEMQCPNCRRVETGQWLFATSNARSSSEVRVDEGIVEEGPVEFTYSGMPFRVQWCPFGGFMRVRSSFEEIERPPAMFAGIRRNPAIFFENGAPSYLPHSYVAYLQPLPPASGNSNENAEDPIFTHHLSGGLSGNTETYASHAYPPTDVHYPILGHRSHSLSYRNHIDGPNQVSVPPVPMRRPGPVAHPFPYGHGSGSQFVSSTVYPGSNNRVYGRNLTSHAIHHPQQHHNATNMMTPTVPGARGFHNPRGFLPLVLSAASQSDNYRGFFTSPHSGASGQDAAGEAENLQPTQFQVISSGHRSFNYAAAGSDYGNRYDGIWQRRGP